MNNTGLQQLNMWTFADAPAEAVKAGQGISDLNGWMSWLADSHAKIFPSLANVRVYEKAHALVFGGNSFGSLATYDPELSCWKMSPGLPIKTRKRWGYFDKRMRCWLLVRLPKSAMTRNGKLYLLPMPAHPTFAIAGSAWPTLTADDTTLRQIPRMETIHVTEAGTLKYINPSGQSHIRLSQTIQYYEDKANWHTLTANDGEKTGAIDLKRENGLSAQVRWATLKAEGNHQKNSRDKHVSLGKQVQVWTTLKARDERGEGFETGLKRHTPNLTTQVQLEEKQSIRLNPNWCEQLMGFPVGWTEPQVDLPRFDGESLMTHAFPAPPGPQLPHEVSRTTDKTAYRRDRIKALGNGVVPQVVLPIAQAIHDYLENEDNNV